MRRHKHLFDEVVSLKNLLAAARSALKGKRNRDRGALLHRAGASEVFIADDLIASALVSRLGDNGKADK